MFLSSPQSLAKPDVFWYNSGAELANDPAYGPINLGSTLAIEFLLFHWVEVRRWQARQPASISERIPSCFRGCPRRFVAKRQIGAAVHSCPDRLAPDNVIMVALSETSYRTSSPSTGHEEPG